MVGGRDRLSIDVRALRTQWPLVVNAVADGRGDVLVVAVLFEEGAAFLDLHSSKTLVSVLRLVNVHEETGLAGSVPDLGTHRVLAVLDGRSGGLDTTLDLPVVGAQHLLHLGIVRRVAVLLTGSACRIPVDDDLAVGVVLVLLNELDG